MRQNIGVIGVHSFRPILWVAIICFGIVMYFYHSDAMRMSPDDIAAVIADSQNSAVKDQNNHGYINLILFLQMGIGLSFIVVPFAIAIYRNRALLHRLNQRVQFYQLRKEEGIIIQDVEAQGTEDLFFTRLLQAHPNLTPHDLTLCSLLRQNYSSKEIADKLNITTGSVNTARYRLRKKLAMKKEADLIIYLRKIA